MSYTPASRQRAWQRKQVALGRCQKHGLSVMERWSKCRPWRRVRICPKCEAKQSGKRTAPTINPDALADLYEALKECAHRLGLLCLASGDLSEANARAIDQAQAALKKAEGTQL